MLEDKSMPSNMAANTNQTTLLKTHGTIKYLPSIVFVDTRLWKTKHSRKRFQNFRQSYVLST